VEQIDPDTIFQWYDVSDLLNDITTVMARNLHHPPSSRLRIVNFFTEPIRTSDIIDDLFPAHSKFTKPRGHKVNWGYDLWTTYGTMFACSVQHYMRSSKEIMEKLRKFVQNWKEYHCFQS
jgi:hypothetical protein